MRKISLIPYKIADGPTETVQGKDGNNTLVKMPDIMYNMKLAIASMLFATENRLGIRDLIEHDRIARKVEAAGEEVFLEEAEYQRLKDAVLTHTGYHRPDLEFIARVMDAAEITVKEV